jgi:MFS family permease
MNPVTFLIFHSDKQSFLKIYFLKKFWIFLILRGLVGIGEASYSCIAPTLIGDLFTDQTRTKMLAVFYLAVPVGSGLGYIVGSSISNALNDWRWAMRFTPPLGFVCVVLLTFFVREPKRGGAEGSVVYEENKASLAKDIVYLFKK